MLSLFTSLRVLIIRTEDPLRKNAVKGVEASIDQNIPFNLTPIFTIRTFHAF